MVEPRFQITPALLELCSLITYQVGLHDGTRHSTSKSKFLNQCYFQSVYHTLAMDGNSLSLKKIKSIAKREWVAESPSETQEVHNALRSYEHLEQWQATKVSSFLKAHALMFNHLSSSAGEWRVGKVRAPELQRSSGVRIKPEKIPKLMKQLFKFLRSSSSDVHPLIQSGIFLFEMEMLQPFAIGNGRLGRLWQHVILSEFHPCFQRVPLERGICAEQEHYRSILKDSEKKRDATAFIEFSLQALLADLQKSIQPHL